MHRHHAQLAGLVVFDEVGDRADAGADLVAQHVGHHRRAAAVGRGLQVQLVLLADQLDQEFRHRRRRRHADGALAALRSHPGDVVGEARLRRRAARHRQRVDEGGEAGDRHEVAAPGRSPGSSSTSGRMEIVWSCVRKQRVAVGAAPPSAPARRSGRRRRPVVHDHRRAELVLQLLGQRARDRVGAAARRKADQDADRRGCCAGAAPAAARASGQQQAGDARSGRWRDRMRHAESIAAGRLTPPDGRCRHRLRRHEGGARLVLELAGQQLEQCPAAAPAGRCPAAPSAGGRPSRRASAPAAAASGQPWAVSATDTLRRLSSAGLPSTSPRACRPRSTRSTVTLSKPSARARLGLAQARMRLQHREHAELRRRRARRPCRRPRTPRPRSGAHGAAGSRAGHRGGRGWSRWSAVAGTGVHD